MTNHHHSQPNRPTSCEDVAELIGAYSIGATTTEENRAIEALLPGCPEVAAELAEYAAVTDAMLYMLPGDDTPPADLIRRMPLNGDATHTPPLVAHHTFTHTEAHRHSAPERVPLPQGPPQPAAEPKRGFPWLAVTGLAAMFIVIVGMNAVWFSLFRGLQTQQAQLTALIDQQTTQLQQQAAQIEQQAEQITQASAAPTPAQQPSVLALSTTHHTELRPTVDGTDSASAQVIWDAASHIGALYVEGLPPPPADHGYQMWLVRGEGEISLGTFSVDGNGVGTMVFQSPLPIMKTDIFGISTEPLNGSLYPTTPHLVTGRVEA